MGNCCIGCCDWCATLGPNPKIITCPLCNKRTLRGRASIEYIKKFGCTICRIKSKYEKGKYYSPPDINKAVGRYHKEKNEKNEKSLQFNSFMQNYYDKYLDEYSAEVI